MTSNNSNKYNFDALKSANVFPCGVKKQGISVVKPGALEEE